MKIEPRCLAMEKTKQLMFSSYGYMLPCCECDTEKHVVDFKTLGFFKDSFHLSNLNTPEDIKEVLNSEEWQSFYKGLLDDPDNAPSICKTFCKQGTYFYK